MLRFYASLTAILVAAGCSPVLVRQSSLVPAASLPPLPSFEGKADVSIGDSTVAFLAPPRLAPNENAGLWIPRTQFEGALGLRIGRHTSFRLLFLDALPQGAMRAAPTTLQSPDASALGAGFGFVFHAPVPEHGLEVHLAADAVFVNIPTLVFVESAAPVRDDEMVTVASITVSVAGQVGEHVRLHGTVGVRNHPTNIGERLDSDTSAEVSPGPANVLLAAGAEIDLAADALTVIPQVQLPVTADPVRYGPILSLALRGTIGDSPKPTP